MSRHGTLPGSTGGTTPPGARLDVQVLFAPALPMVRLRGELRPGTVHLVREAMLALAATSGLGKVVVLDISGLTRCDRGSLRAVGQTAFLLEQAGKELTIEGSPDCILELLG